MNMAYVISLQVHISHQEKTKFFYTIFWMPTFVCYHVNQLKTIQIDSTIENYIHQ